MKPLETIDFSRVFELLDFQSSKYPQEAAALSHDGHGWKQYSTEALRQGARAFAAWLNRHGVVKGDHVAIVPLMGCPEWLMIDFGCQQIGAIVVPMHPSAGDGELEFILKETDACGCICANISLSDRVTALRSQLPALRFVEPVATLETTLTSEENPNPNPVQTAGSDIVAIMYTSGTSGQPKGVVLTHDNLVSSIKSMLTLFPLEPGQRVLSFLPFSHIFERASCYAYLAFGVSIHFSRGLEHLREDFLTARPYFCTSVPRTLEKMYDILQEQREEKGWLKRQLIGWAMRIGLRYTDSRMGIGLRFQLAIARLLVLGRWRRALGGHIRYMGVGAAALRPDIARLFSAARVIPLSGYGMTEASPFISTNRYLPGLNRFGTVGIPVPCVEIRIDSPNETGEGEIQVKGPNVMNGYFKRPELNAEVFTTDGWFRTGDVGHFVARRFLAITDRKKDIFKTSTGKYVAPQTVQNQLLTSPFISQCLIFGFNRPFVAAILVPHFELLKTWCTEQKIHWTSPPFMVHNIKVVQKYQEEVDRLNETLQSHERIKRFILSDEEWTVENRELTTSFKPMRIKLMEKHSAQIEKLYL
jgi:long-chain acyl-CoA synthetase